MKNFTTLAAYLIISLTASNLYGQIALGDDRIVLTNERRVNSDELEYSPVFYKDGIVFVTTRSENLLYNNIRDHRAGGIHLMSMFWSQRDEEGFLKEPERFSNELITKVHEGPMTFDRTASTIFFTRNELVELAPDKLLKMQIYQAEKDSLDIWGNVQKLPFNNIAYNFMHPTINAEGDVLYVSSDVPGGQGGMDLYVVKKVGGTWGQMVNLGPTVNTPGNEVFPYIAADGALYFSSDGHGGMGNLDLFFTIQSNGTQKWSTPENMGVPFCSPTDDLGFIVDSENRNGYFSSDRNGGFGADDIYGFHVDGPSSQFASANRNLDSLVVKDADGNPMEGVSISAINFNEIALSANDEQQVNLLPGDGGVDNFVLDVNSGEMGEKGITGSDGTAKVPLRRGSSVIKIAKEGYLPEYVMVTPETDISKLDIKLRKASNCVPLDGELLMLTSKTAVAGAEIHIVDVDSKEAIIVYSDRQGKFDYCLPCNRTFSIYAVRNGVNSAPGIVSTKETPCTQDARIPLTLYIGGTPLYAGMTIQLPNIYFNFDDASLRPDAYPDLNEVVAMLNSYPGMKLELASHTDSRGGTAYNFDLSNRRSASVLKYLKSKGIDGNRLVPRGYGESQLRNRCTSGVACSEREHQYNRRTEVKILEMGEPELAAENTAPIADNDNSDNNNLDDPTAGEPDAGKGGEDEVSGEPDVVPVSNNGAGGYKSKSFTVVAGTFANQDNATRRHELLTKMGYSNTTIVKQSRSGLLAIYVNTFDTKTDAFGLVKKLADQQLSAYVLRQ
ncbi:MAG: OmpA family protein [Saprospiraceae bacterium]|nr:OmpA family protein [Saprospiraceae bacterium]